MMTAVTDEQGNIIEYTLEATQNNISAIVSYLENIRDNEAAQALQGTQNLENYDFNNLIDSFKSIQGTTSPQTLLSDLLNNYAELSYSKLFEVSKLLNL